MASPTRRSAPEPLSLVADVIVIGGGPAGAWAAIAARSAGCEVILADKGFLGTSGATAPSNTETWLVPPGASRTEAIDRHYVKTGEYCEPAHVERVLDGSWRGLNALVEWGYPFPQDESGRPYLRNLRGPDYMRFLRRRVIGMGVQVLDHHPALELLGDADGIAGAAGVDRQAGNVWTARASAVVLATGGCAFGERILGATGLTGDGYLMALEAGAALSGMEMSSQYAVSPIGSSVSKGMNYRWATFFDQAGNTIAAPNDDRQVVLADAMLRGGPIYARLDRASAEQRDWMRRGQPNCFLPFDRIGIDPFTMKFEVTLRCEGTVRGVGGIQLVSDQCETGVPGLYAAGDVASREDLMGAITGGGGPNASWAIASGMWAGDAAGAYARKVRVGRDQRRGRPFDGAGLGRHRASAHAAAREQHAEIQAAVRAHMLPLARNFYRTADSLAGSLATLDALWSQLPPARRDVRARGTETVKLREAAAMLFAGRCALTSALARRVSHGMHRRVDQHAGDTSVDAPRRILLGGIDVIAVTPIGRIGLRRVTR